MGQGGLMLLEDGLLDKLAALADDQLWDLVLDSVYFWGVWLH